MTQQLSLREILQKQYEQYPLMLIEDAVKLIYQNEFAGGHLIEDEVRSLKLLTEEYASLKLRPKNMGLTSVFEDIGNGLCRLNLGALGFFDITLPTINKCFVRTADEVHGNIKKFERKLEVLRECCKDGLLPFDIQDVDFYLCIYKSKGYPAVSHSSTYREAYRPAYRIVKTTYRDFFKALCSIDSLLKELPNVLVAIDGNCCGGKTSLAELLKGVFDCNLFHMDDFFLPPLLRTPQRLKEPGGNVDYIRFKEEVLDPLKSGGEFRYRIYDCATQHFSRSIGVFPKRLTIIEGSYSMHPTFAGSYQLKIFMQADPSTQKQRVIERNSQTQDRFFNEWIPLENEYFAHFKIMESCDIVFTA